MQAIVLEKPGGLQNLRRRETPRPQAGTGEVVVQIEAAALNRRDLWIIEGKYPNIKLPAILGSDGAGRVVETGKNVDPSWKGKAVVLYPALEWGADPAVQSPNYRVLGMPDDGTLAEFIAVPAENLVEKPSYLSFEAAAALALGGLTAYRALFTHGNLQAGQTVLITGAGGGVAGLALQMAAAAGAQVLVTSGSDSKIEKARKLGADGGANYRHAAWTETIKKLAGNDEPDIIIDSAGGDGLNDLISLVRPGGRIVCYGSTNGLPSGFHLPRLFWKQIRLQGSTMGSPSEFRKMVGFFATHKIQPVIDTVLPLSQYRDAFRKLPDRNRFGKIVLILREE